MLITLDHLSEAERTLLIDILGEGEVSGIVAMPDRRVVQIQESVFAGLWRVRIEGDDARPALDYVEIGAMPEIGQPRRAGSHRAGDRVRRGARTAR